MGDIYRIREIGILQKGLDMSLVRQSAITANVANAETPGYKAIRVGFEEKFKAALGQSVGMSETHPMHFPNKGKGIHGVAPQLTESQAGATLDGNNVNLDDEFVKSATNASHYKTLLTATNMHLRQIISALDGGVAK